MATTKEVLIESNRAQTVSETDDFTVERYRQMAAHLPFGSESILDAGCNTGRGGRVIRDLFPVAKLVGLDCIEERVATLDKSVYSQAICSFSSELAIPDTSFDGVVAGEFLEHVPPAEIDRTLCEFFRILKLRGRVVMTTPNPSYIKNKLKNLSVLQEPSHLTQHYSRCLKFRMMSVGFSHVRVFGSGRMTRYLGQRIPCLPIYGSYLIRGEKW